MARLIAGIMRATTQMNRRIFGTTFGIALLSLLASAGTAPAESAAGSGGSFVPDEVIVKFDGEARSRARPLPAGVGVRAVTAALRRNPDVAYAAPNFIATASASRP